MNSLINFKMLEYKNKCKLLEQELEILKLKAKKQKLNSKLSPLKKKQKKNVKKEENLTNSKLIEN